MTPETDPKALIARLKARTWHGRAEEYRPCQNFERGTGAACDHCYQSLDAHLLRESLEAIEALSSSVSSETPRSAVSPVLAFPAWALERAAKRGAMTQDEYFLAKEAFFAAHPGKGPQSSLMVAAASETQEERPDLRAALVQFWELAHAWKPNTTVPEFHSGSDSEWRREYLSQQHGARDAAVQAVLDMVAQSSPVPHEANKES